MIEYCKNQYLRNFKIPDMRISQQKSVDELKRLLEVQTYAIRLLQQKNTALLGKNYFNPLLRCKTDLFLIPLLKKLAKCEQLTCA